MKKQIAARLALVMCLACCPIAFALQAAQSQNKQSQSMLSLTDTQRNNVLEHTSTSCMLTCRLRSPRSWEL